MKVSVTTVWLIPPSLMRSEEGVVGSGEWRRMLLCNVRSSGYRAAKDIAIQHKAWLKNVADR
jgi:hypothetical protein